MYKITFLVPSAFTFARIAVSSEEGSVWPSTSKWRSCVMKCKMVFLLAIAAFQGLNEGVR
jgi:hypothetical protein